MKKQTSWLVTAIAIGLPLVAASQADIANAASAAALRYLSAFADYKPWQDVQAGDWRAMNDVVRGTTAGHAGQGSPPAAAPGPGKPPAPAGQQAPSGSGHGGHQMHGGQK